MWQKPAENVFDEMMRASKQQAEKASKKKKSLAEMESNSEKKRSPTREAGKDGEDELEALGGVGQKPSWHPSTLSYIFDIRERMIDSCGFEERGTHHRYGEWPKFALGVAVTFPDPLVHAQTNAERDEIDPTFFARPDILFWGPELRWPGLYLEGSSMLPLAPYVGLCAT